MKKSLIFLPLFVILSFVSSSSEAVRIRTIDVHYTTNAVDTTKKCYLVHWKIGSKVGTIGPFEKQIEATQAVNYGNQAYGAGTHHMENICKLKKN